MQLILLSSKEHLDKAKYILHYLAGTVKYVLVCKDTSNKGLIAYTDSDYAADLVKRRSTTGYHLKLANGIISWQSRAQKTIALSATEAEYMALSDCSRQVVWIQNIFTELGFPVQPTQICADNEGGIFIVSNPVQEHQQTGHVCVLHCGQYFVILCNTLLINSLISQNKGSQCNTRTCSVCWWTTHQTYWCAVPLCAWSDRTKANRRRMGTYWREFHWYIHQKFGIY